jgi:hypothetical protein
MVSSGVPGNPGFGLLEWKGYGPKANGSEFNIRLIAAFCQAETCDQNTNKNRNFSAQLGFKFLFGDSVRFFPSSPPHPLLSP